MKTIKMLGFASLLVVNSAFAVTPENGWWWNPQAPGTGYNIETQNGTLFVATFVYDNNGNPIWYSGSGQIGGGTTVIVNLFQSKGGPCFGCVYSTPKTSESGYQITLSFPDHIHGIVTANGYQTPIERLNFNLGTDISKALGPWFIVIPNLFGVQSLNGFGLSDIITYSQVSNGAVIGRRVAGGISAVAPTPEADIYISLTQISAQKNTATVFRFNSLNNIIGMIAIVNPAASAQEIADEIKAHGLPFVGARVIISPSDIPSQATASAHTESLAAEDPQPLNIESVSNLAAEVGLSVDNDTLTTVKSMAVSRAIQP
jgi:hypothetical protein